ncbi:MAG TPA: O-antigen ligase family protein [Bryobacteraceae bacterium]|nr:O-antigen ligase family protein [Bryobacteraceae bacterium]
MSRFNHSSAVLDAPREKAAAAPSLILQPSPSDVGLGQRFGFVVLCVFAISGYANEFAVQLFNAKAYISTISWILLPLLLVLSGNLLRPFRDKIGILWFAFLAWVVLAVPFSVWKGGSFALLVSYVPHGWLQLSYYAAFLVSVKHCRRLMFFIIASNFLLLLDCFLFGTTKNGRFEIPHSIFFTNANDLALQLLIAITQFMYLVYQPQVWKHIAGGGAILIALTYMLRTASRGAVLAIVILGVIGFAFAKNRMRLALLGVPAALAALILVPSSVLHRLTLIGLQPEKLTASNMDDASAFASQMERMALFRQSVTYAITHPLFGVGPGQFAVAAYGEAVKSGTQSPWLGTHNSYTQVASECGIPAFLLYTSVIVISLVSNFRIFRRTARLSQYSDLSALAFCTFNATLAYAVCTFFFHIAYSGYLPCIAGMSVALRLGTHPSLWSSRAAYAAR